MKKAKEKAKKVATPQQKGLHGGNVHLYVLAACGALVMCSVVFALATSLYAMRVPEVQVREEQQNAPGMLPDLGMVNMNRFPVRFEPNLGQVSDDAQFLARAGGFPVRISAQTLTTQDFKQRLVGANPSAAAVTHDEAPQKVNYLLGSKKSEWKTNIPTYGKIGFAQVYPGIDVEYLDSEGSLNYQFVVAPQANPQVIELALEGVDEMEVFDSRIAAVTSRGTLNWDALHVYQVVDGKTVAVQAKFIKKSSNSYGFALGEYDKSLPVVIDPTMLLQMSSYLGGTGTTDTASFIKLDASGNIYLGGITNSTDFPTQSPLQAANAGSQDVYIVKMNPSATQIIFSTYIGGSGSDGIGGFGFDGQGNIVIAGNTASSNFPVQNAHQSTFAGATDAYLTKLNTTASEILFSTYLGGTGNEQVNYMEVAPNGEYIVTTYSFSTDFPVLNAFQSTNGGSQDNTVSRFSSTGTLLSSTYLGGNGVEGTGALIGFDNNGNIIITGATSSTNFPTVNPYQAAHAGAGDAYLVKFDPTMQTMIFGTYFGGTGAEGTTQSHAQPIVDSNGNIYLSGYTQSGNLPVTGDAFQSTRGGSGSDRDLFIAKFSSNGQSLLYSTYLGGSSGENAARRLLVESTGELTIIGQTLSANMPVANPLQATLGGSTDTYIAKLMPGESTLRFGSYLGGTGSDIAQDAAYAANGDLYLVGSTGSANFPTTTGAFQTALSGTGDGFIARISFSNCPPGCGGGSSPAPYVAVSYPNGYQQFSAGQQVQVTWYAQMIPGSMEVRLSLVGADQSTVIPLAEAISLESGYAAVTIPSTITQSMSAKLLMEVVNPLGGVYMSDISDGYFTIQGNPNPPTQQTAPTADEPANQDIVPVSEPTSQNPVIDSAPVLDKQVSAPMPVESGAVPAPQVLVKSMVKQPTKPIEIRAEVPRQSVEVSASQTEIAKQASTDEGERVIETPIEQNSFIEWIRYWIRRLFW